MKLLILIYLLTTIGLSPGGSSTVHIYTKTVQYSTHLHTTSTVQYTFTHKQYTERHKTNNTQKKTTIWESAGRAPSWLVIPWHLPYN